VNGIDVSELISDPDFAETFTIRRQTPTMVDGETRTTSADIAVTGAVQPASPAELKALPEGDRTRDVRVFWSKTEILATRGSPDVLVYGGAEFRVVKVEQRKNYWKAFAGGLNP
jgi:hypothetical protein